MKWENILNKKDEVFRRLMRVKREVFEKMLGVIEANDVSHHKFKGAKRGRKSRLSNEEKLLILLMYYREYRSFLHIAEAYKISEGYCWKLVTRLEKLLLKSEFFHLPKRTKLTSFNTDFEIILVDITESPIERPKKTRPMVFWKKEKTYFKKSDCSE